MSFVLTYCTTLSVIWSGNIKRCDHCFLKSSLTRIWFSEAFHRRSEERLSCRHEGFRLKRGQKTCWCWWCHEDYQLRRFWGCLFGLCNDLPHVYRIVCKSILFLKSCYSVISKMHWSMKQLMTAINYDQIIKKKSNNWREKLDSRSCQTWAHFQNY